MTKSTISNIYLIVTGIIAITVIVNRIIANIGNKVF